MKKFVALIAALILILSVGIASAETYQVYGRVCGIVYEEDFFLVYANGNVWELSGVDEWKYNDIVLLDFDDEETENLYDDEILDIHYLGYLDLK